MNTLKTAVMAFLVLASMTVASAQEQYQLLSASTTFSHKKISYITMNDGKEVTGYIKNLDRKKGLIEEVKIKTEAGKVMKIDPSKIKSMYLPQSGWDKFANAMDKVYDAQRWDDKEVKSDIIQKGYAYFEKSDVMIKKKKRTLLLMLLNPHYAGKVKIYHDPFASETVGLGVGGVTMIGGATKSYYIKKGKAVANRVKMKDYTEQFFVLFGDCEGLVAMNKKQGHNPKWTELQLHTYTYTTECN